MRYRSAAWKSDPDKAIKKQQLGKIRVILMKNRFNLPRPVDFRPGAGGHSFRFKSAACFDMLTILGR
jgi:hypothetical protein